MLSEEKVLPKAISKPKRVDPQVLFCLEFFNDVFRGMSLFPNRILGGGCECFYIFLCFALGEMILFDYLGLKPPDRIQSTLEATPNALPLVQMYPSRKTAEYPT